MVASGIQTLLYAGDADFICCVTGVQGVAEAITWSGSTTFKNKALASYTVNGTASGLFKTVDNLSFIQVYGAGHEVPYYGMLYLESVSLLY